MLPVPALLGLPVSVVEDKLEWLGVRRLLCDVRDMDFERERRLRMEEFNTPAEGRSAFDGEELWCRSEAEVTRLVERSIADFDGEDEVERPRG